MDMITIEIPGSPVPWSAPRIGRTNRAFSPDSKKKEYIQWQIKSQYRGDILEGPFSIYFKFELQIPKSISKKKKQLMEGAFALVRPDTTNLQKMYEDCLMGIVFKDDNEVCKIFSLKTYSENPRTTICILKL